MTTQTQFNVPVMHSEAMTHDLPASAQAFVSALRRLMVGELTLVVPGGRRLVFKGGIDGPRAELHVHDWRACARILSSGDIGFGHAYGAGWVDSPDLASLARLALRNEQVVVQAVQGNWLMRSVYAIMHALRRNSRAGSRRNIHAHYDIGNAFYRLWLDASMTYSSAWFEGDFSPPLHTAQSAKYQRIVDQLGLKPGMRVLEVGCGWGGFAEHAGRQGIHVHGITISDAQLSYARARIHQAGLQDKVNIEWCDYRDLAGDYDAIVSIEMFEAVGEPYWQGYFDLLRRCLRQGGQALIQTITIDEKRFENYRRSSDFIREYIFPGGMLPSVERFCATAQRSGLAAVQVDAFGPDYAETLRRWRASFEQQLPTIRGQGFDERFIRLWRFYLAYCEAGFDEGSTNVVHVRLEHARA